jgi:hypothetical protein
MCTALLPFRAPVEHLPLLLGEQQFVRAHAALVSPSLYVYKHFGFLPLEDHTRTSSGALTADEMTVRASTNSEQLPLLLDNRAETRWSPSRGVQRGDGSEWLEVEASVPIYLEKLLLPVGSFSTDFPRGVRVVASTACGETGRSIELFKQPSWQGPLRFTTGGYPYFGHEQEVELPIGSASAYRCYRIEQIGTNGAFDWSVAELGVIGSEQ